MCRANYFGIRQRSEAASRGSPGVEHRPVRVQGGEAARVTAGTDAVRSLRLYPADPEKT